MGFYALVDPPPFQKITYVIKLQRNYFQGDCDDVA